MPEQNVFRWRDGRGWLVFSGRLSSEDDDPGDVRSLVLARSAADGGVACISLSEDINAADQLLDSMEQLGAPAGFQVDVFSEDDETITARLSEAGVIVIGSAPDMESGRSALMGAPFEGFQAAYSNGAIILVEGESVAAFGAWVIREDGLVVEGNKWLEGAALLATASKLAASARPVFDHEPAAFAVGIGDGSALALGPDGQVEIWGRGQVVVALGPMYTSSAHIRGSEE